MSAYSRGSCRGPEKCSPRSIWVQFVPHFPRDRTGRLALAMRPRAYIFASILNVSFVQWKRLPAIAGGKDVDIARVNYRQITEDALASLLAFIRQRC